jgi:hypothetical protein
MLCLTRKVGERILLPGTSIIFTILAVKPGGAVRIGIEADRESGSSGRKWNCERQKSERGRLSHETGSDRDRQMVLRSNRPMDRGRTGGRM